jgi:acyl-CoA thioesterase FadM
MFERVIIVPHHDNPYGFDLVYRLECLDTARDLARGKIGIVSVEHETRKVAAVPAAFLRRVADLKIA